MKKRTLLLIGVLMAAVCCIAVIAAGSAYTLRISVDPETVADDYQVEIDQDREIIRLTDKKLENGILFLRIRSAARGRAFISVCRSDEFGFLEAVYVHRFGVITVDNYFGRSAGAWIIPVLATVYIALLLLSVILRYRRNMRESLYQYSNIRNLGWIIFLAFMLLGQIPYLFSGDSFVGTVSRTLAATSSAAYFAFPVAFILSVLVAISNIQLMRREGRSWRNMLGLMLGLLVCIGTVFPFALSEFLQRTTVVDVHNERGAALYVEMAVTNTILIAVSYLECILWGTVILSVKAAGRTPPFDRDYILILGCQIKKDGTPTPLLKGRADRALDFARMQKEATGKSVVFVPSGGKGPDEIIPEALSVRNYLAEAGIPDERILVEDGSFRTEENFQKSLVLIRKESAAENPKIAFSTTNYHVFRSGVLARRQGIDAEGVGSSTKSYFWINAFVREFIATVYTEWRKHLRVIVLLILMMLAMIGIVCLSNYL